MNKQAYWGREVAEVLGISGSSLRKYCIALEKSGHHFVKGSNNSRAFTERGIILLRRMKDLVQDRRVTTQDASEIVVVSKDLSESRTGVVRDKRFLVKYELSDVLAVFEHQKQLNIQLINEFQKTREEFYAKSEQQQRYIESLEKQLYREKEYQKHRDQQLTAMAKDILETKKLVAVSKEEAEKRKKWWRFW